MSRIGSRTEGLTRHDGFLPFYWDASAGKLVIEIARPNEEFLYLCGLASGAGSVDVGLD
jgi:hypothetical protein